VELSVRTVRSIESVNSADWNALDHGPAPFLEHGFLTALERSGSIGKRAGWDPVYLLAEIEGDLVGAVPAFVKAHSYGEYIFDWGWARASERAGLRYYPKLVVAAPVTPATGRRILLHPDLDEDVRGIVAKTLIAAVKEVADQTRCSSIHWLFCTQDEQHLLESMGFSSRLTYQFHWHNAGYADFDGFLDALASRKRKNLRKERKKAQANIDELRFVSGNELDDDDVAAMDRYYRSTVQNHGGWDYLQPGFFEHLVKLMPERVQFARVTRQGERVAGALFLETAEALYGRYWGCDEELDCLHFETAYYAGIERCIDRGIPLFEAGAQGEHKLLRGFMPSPTYSSHWIRHAGLRRGIEEFLASEAHGVARHMRELADYAPYKKVDPDPCGLIDGATSTEPTTPVDDPAEP